jgi:amidase
MAGYNPEFDAPVNPWNAERWSGVSSSGSGVAVAAGLCYGAIGTDTGGSIRFPSAVNGTVGLKPTWGRVSRFGVLNLAESLDHVGPLTRRVEDAAAFLEVIAGHDPKDPTSSARPVPAILAKIDAGVKGLRIGVDEAYLTRDVDPDVSAAVRAAIAVLEEQGATLVAAIVPPLDEAVACWSILCSAEAALAHERTYPAKADSYGPWFRSWLEIGRSVSGADYARANNVRNAIRSRFAALMQETDLLACPSTAFPAHPITHDLLYGPLLPPGPGDPTSVMMRYTVPTDFTGQPTLSVPCGFSRDGLPLSLQLVGRMWEEEVVCRAGYAYQQATEWHSRHPLAD